MRRSSSRRQPAEHRAIHRLMAFFAVVYIVEGMGQTGGLIAQPLNYFLKETYGWTPVQVTTYLTVLNLPWIIKPLYGLISDFVPLFGYRRKAYLVLANAGGAAAYLWIAGLTTPSLLLLALLLSAYAMAVSSTLSGAVLVENGQKFGASDVFVNQQWLWFNIAATASAVIGGVLVERLSAPAALHVAAAIIAVAPLLAVGGTLLLIDERRSAIDLVELKATFGSLVATFRRRELWVIGAFLFLYYFSPGIGTPLYYYMTDTLKFSQEYIGILGAINSVGWIAGSFVHRWLLQDLTSRALLNVSILLGTAAMAAFLLLDGPISAALVNFASGIAGMIAFVATLTLAADFCPKRSEGFAFAALMSVTNLSAALSDNAGSLLYERVFSGHLAPLIIVSAVATAVAFPFVPLLRLGDKPSGRAIEPATAGEATAPNPL